MKKDLQHLSAKELGKLFPIEIVPHNKSWNKLFKTEQKLIQKTLGDVALRIEHFGSTAIEGIAAKPAIDILIEIPPLTQELKEMIVAQMKNIHYHFIWRTDEQIPYMNFVKGYTPQGYKGNIFHLHMADKTHRLWDRLYFRDYLRMHKEVAMEYEKIKLASATKHKFNRENYTKAKEDFVKRMTEIAKKEIG